MEVMSLNFGTDGFDLEATLEVMPLSFASILDVFLIDLV